MDVRLGETAILDFLVYDADGVPTDADSTPTCAVFEDDTDTAILTPTVTKRASLTGHYRVPIAATTDNGFEVGKSYSIKISATVDSVSSAAIIGRFVLRAVAQVYPSNFANLGINGSGHVERVVLVDTTTTNSDMRGTDGANTTTPPTADAVAQAVLRRDAASDDGNAAEHSLYTVIQSVKNFSTTATPGSLVIYRTNGTTVHTTIPLDTDATAEAIVSAGIP
jgi:hypothetical protein